MYTSGDAPWVFYPFDEVVASNWPTCWERVDSSGKQIRNVFFPTGSKGHMFSRDLYVIVKPDGSKVRRFARFTVTYQFGSSAAEAARAAYDSALAYAAAAGFQIATEFVIPTAIAYASPWGGYLGIVLVGDETDTIGVTDPNPDDDLPIVP